MTDEQWRRRLEANDAATFIAVSNGRDVGMAVGAPYGDAAGLFAMWVDPGARGKGVGDALVSAVINWVREKGFERVLLDVGDLNEPAINLYKRNGFKPTGHAGTLPSPRTHLKEHQRLRWL